MTTVAVAEPFPGEREVTDQVVREHKLNATEYRAIIALLERVPTLTELGIFSALWSEHCSYKHTKPVLRRFPVDGPQVVQGPGENAGVLRLPDGWAVAFKIESHNHPSAVEPYQGAATGVGGILRDVFTMGARPVAVLNSLRLGPLDDARNRYLFAGIVKGVGDYGNCVGIPTLAGEVCVRAVLHRQSAGQRDGGRVAAGSRSCDGAGARRRQHSPRRGRENRSRRHSRRVIRVRGSHGREREAPAAGAGRRSVHRKAAARSVPRADHRRLHRRHPGHGGRRIDLVLGGDGGARRRRRRGRHQQGADARARHDTVRDHAVRVAGADAGRCGTAPTRRDPGRVPEVGSRRNADRPRHRRRHLPRRARRSRGRGDSRQGTGGWLSDVFPPGGRIGRRQEPARVRADGERPRLQRHAGAAARCADDREQAMGVRAVRRHGAGGQCDAAGW